MVWRRCFKANNYSTPFLSSKITQKILLQMNNIFLPTQLYGNIHDGENLDKECQNDEKIHH
jgi:hypothetical protein